MDGQRNGRWSLKDPPQLHGKRDGIGHPSTHIVEFEDTLEAMGVQVRNLDTAGRDIFTMIGNIVN